ncbi:hypothetical protein ACHAW6_014523 [Cyclotella cf. meneghiniana]
MGFQLLVTSTTQQWWACYSLCVATLLLILPLQSTKCPDIPSSLLTVMNLLSFESDVTSQAPNMSVPLCLPLPIRKPTVIQMLTLPVSMGMRIHRTPLHLQQDWLCFYGFRLPSGMATTIGKGEYMPGIS